jgi:hypothetical protein
LSQQLIIHSEIFLVFPTIRLTKINLKIRLRVQGERALEEMFCTVGADDDNRASQPQNSFHEEAEYKMFQLTEMLLKLILRNATCSFSETVILLNMRTT